MAEHKDGATDEPMIDATAQAPAAGGPGGAQGSSNAVGSNGGAGGSQGGDTVDWLITLTPAAVDALIAAYNGLRVVDGDQLVTLTRELVSETEFRVDVALVPVETAPIAEE